VARFRRRKPAPKPGFDCRVRYDDRASRGSARSARLDPLEASAGLAGFSSARIDFFRRKVRGDWVGVLSAWNRRCRSFGAVRRGETPQEVCEAGMARRLRSGDGEIAQDTSVQKRKDETQSAARSWGSRRQRRFGGFSRRTRILENSRGIRCQCCRFLAAPARQYLEGRRTSRKWTRSCL
jgi:hypothetical protein